MLAEAVVSFEVLAREGFAFKLTQVVSVAHSGGCQQISVLHCILDGGIPQFFALWVSPQDNSQLVAYLVTMRK